MDKTNAETLLAAVIAVLPEGFGLNGFPEDRFRASPTASYVNDDAAPVIYFQRKTASGWVDFSKATLAEALQSLSSYDLREKLRDVRSMHEPFSDLERYVKAIAEKHTVANLGQPEHTPFRQLLEDGGEEIYDAVMSEYRSWLKDSRKDAARVAKAGLPWTLANARDAFFRKGPFAPRAAAAKTARAGKASKRAKAVAK